MLLGQQRGRRQHSDLAPGRDCFERSAHGDLGLAEAHVATEQTIHRHRFFHVGFDLAHRRELVLGLFKREGRLELADIRAVRRHRDAAGGDALGRRSE